MQDVNNDMDDLFRRAAEQYPLKTDGADWQKVFAGLQEASVPVAEEKERKKRRFLWLFLLLPLGLLWVVYYKGNNQPEHQVAVTKTNVKSANNNSQKFDSSSTKSFSAEPESSDHIASELSSGEVEGNRKNAVIDEDKASVVPVGRARAYHKSVMDARSASSVSLKQKKEDFNNKQTVSNSNIDLSNNTIDNQAGNYKNNLPGSQPDGFSNRINKTDQQDNSNQIADAIVQAKTDTTAYANTKTDSISNVSSNKNKSKPVKAKPRVQTGFYAGLLASSDVSTIKLQRIHKTGYGLQALIGYRFSNRLSIESGFGGTVKNYYSKGKYFDKKKTGIPDIVNIYYTNGYCKMFEVPLNVKYDFASTKKGNLFVTAGFSSYFMKKENYSYRGDYRGRVYDTTRYYNNSGANWFSLANVSVGYETRLGRHSSLRIEPYIKVPLRGIGIANLPIASMGISAGFTRKF